MKGLPILTLDGLMWAVKNKKAVICPKHGIGAHPMPAAVMINMQGSTIYRFLQAGLYIYKPKGK